LKDERGGADGDNSALTGVCTSGTRSGVKSVGVEVELFTRPLPNVTFNLGGVLANTKYRNNLVGADGRALTNALFQLPGRRLSNSSQLSVTGALSWTPPIGSSGLRALFYVDGRHQSSINTGSDPDREKVQKGVNVLHPRVRLGGPAGAWAGERWGE